ncbi:hypothetical protein SAMN04489867_1664 [Pedococcus dokdonensis]|uniref:Uncharacterized protein n=1 Tax=Pedococcus dokdonensis TaxID=443156 RepID=A0A1H0QP09_9MICO|nr:hypothetical protein [Pedococcus dokdonensis]SDP18479.1 hypothetical protein SAMN04489867_1664 [Pedococcus dokdonensis]
MSGKRRTAEYAESRVIYARDDARRLAMEVAGLEPGVHVDPVAMRVVLEPDETAWRRLERLWFRVKVDGAWSAASPGQALLTSRRLLVRLHSGEVFSLWWGSLVGFDPDLEREHVVLDYGDGAPRAVTGPGAALVAVAGIASLYGVSALTTHPALTALRRTAATAG